MRVTQNILQKIAIDGMQTNLLRLSKVQKKAITGKRISTPEDDPFAVEQALGFRNRLETGETALKNISLSQNWLFATDKSLDDMVGLLTRAQSLALKGANDTLGPDERASVAVEVDGLLQQAVAIGNSRQGDHYLFAGFKFDVAPFKAVYTGNEITAVDYWGDNGDMLREAEQGTQISINITGDVSADAATGTPGHHPLNDVFDTLVNLRDALKATPFVHNDVSVALDNVKTNMDNLLNLRAAIGTKESRLETTSRRIEDLQVGLNKLLSDAEDADMAEVITELQQRQFVYESALNVNAKVISMSLLDFLR